MADVLDYLYLADTYTHGMGAPLLVLIGGLMGSGKSTLATQLSDVLGVEVLATDAIRRQLFGANVSYFNFGEGVYRPEHRARVYEELFQMASKQLSQGLSIILDGTFLSTPLKARALSIAAKHRAIAVHLHCVCPEQIALDRIARRQQVGESLSAARPELLDLQRREQEPDPSGLRRLDVDTTQPMDDQVRQSCEFLAKSL
jgi:predicted kinase